jgi:hypothetical protein
MSVADRAIAACWLERPVTLCGVGCLGARVAEMLMRMGLKRLRVVDHDRVEEKDCRQGIYWSQHVGARKVDALVALASGIGAPTRIAPLAERCERLGPGCLRGAGLVISALDSMPPRLLLAQAAMEAGVPFLDLAVDGVHGRVTEITGRGACFHCHAGAPEAGDPMAVARASLSATRGCRTDAGRPTVAAPFAIAEVAAAAVGRAVRVLGGMGGASELRLTWTGAVRGAGADDGTGTGTGEGTGGVHTGSLDWRRAQAFPVWRRFDLEAVAGCPTCGGGGSAALAARAVTRLRGCSSAAQPLAEVERLARRVHGPGVLEGPRPWSDFGERPPEALWSEAAACELGVPDGGRLRYRRADGVAALIELAPDDAGGREEIA